MNFTQLTLQNPWWAGAEQIREDPKIRAIETAAYPWTPRLLENLDLDRDLIYSLRGPRQVGKTTLVKCLIRKLLLDVQVPPQHVFYYQCDLIGSGQELADLIAAYLDFRAPYPPHRSFLFLDEISMVPQWQKAVKLLADTGRLQNATLLVTGSHTVDIQTGLELLPGRRGDAASKLDLKLLPLDFGDYVRLRLSNPDGHAMDPDHAHFLNALDAPQTLQSLLKNQPSAEAIALLNLLPHLNRFLDDYLLTGGFLTTINEHLTTGAIQEYFYDIYRSWLVGDLHRLGKSDAVLQETARAILDTLTTPVSWNGLSGRTSIGSHNTVAEYVELLEQNFVLHIVPFYEINQRRANLRKNRKLYFDDPFIHHTFNAWIHRVPAPFNLARSQIETPEQKSCLIESLIGAHLKRAYDQVFYWRDRYHQEVDFVIEAAGTILPIEVKFRTQPGKADFKALSKLGGGLVVTQTHLDLTPPIQQIPAAVYLFLI